MGTTYTGLITILSCALLVKYGSCHWVFLAINCSSICSSSEHVAAIAAQLEGARTRLPLVSQGLGGPRLRPGPRRVRLPAPLFDERALPSARRTERPVRAFVFSAKRCQCSTAGALNYCTLLASFWYTLNWKIYSACTVYKILIVNKECQDLTFACNVVLLITSVLPSHSVMFRRFINLQEPLKNESKFF